MKKVQSHIHSIICVLLSISLVFGLTFFGHMPQAYSDVKSSKSTDQSGDSATAKNKVDSSSSDSKSVDKFSVSQDIIDYLDMMDQSDQSNSSDDGLSGKTDRIKNSAENLATQLMESLVDVDDNNMAHDYWASKAVDVFENGFLQSGIPSNIEKWSTSVKNENTQKQYGEFENLVIDWIITGYLDGAKSWIESKIAGDSGPDPLINIEDMINKCSEKMDKMADQLTEMSANILSAIESTNLQMQAGFQALYESTQEEFDYLEQQNEQTQNMISALPYVIDYNNLSSNVPITKYDKSMYNIEQILLDAEKGTGHTTLQTTNPYTGEITTYITPEGSGERYKFSEGQYKELRSYFANILGCNDDDDVTTSDMAQSIENQLQNDLNKVANHFIGNTESLVDDNSYIKALYDVYAGQILDSEVHFLKDYDGAACLNSVKDYKQSLSLNADMRLTNTTYQTLYYANTYKELEALKYHLMSYEQNGQIDPLTNIDGTVKDSKSRYGDAVDDVQRIAKGAKDAFNIMHDKYKANICTVSFPVTDGCGVRPTNKDKNMYSKSLSCLESAIKLANVAAKLGFDVTISFDDCNSAVQPVDQSQDILPDFSSSLKSIIDCLDYSATGSISIDCGGRNINTDNFIPVEFDKNSELRCINISNANVSGSNSFLSSNTEGNDLGDHARSKDFKGTFCLNNISFEGSLSSKDASPIIWNGSPANDLITINKCNFKNYSGNVINTSWASRVWISSCQFSNNVSSSYYKGIALDASLDPDPNVKVHVQEGDDGLYYPEDLGLINDDTGTKLSIVNTTFDSNKMINSISDDQQCTSIIYVHTPVVEPYKPGGNIDKVIQYTAQKDIFAVEKEKLNDELSSYVYPLGTDDYITINNCVFHDSFTSEGAIVVEQDSQKYEKEFWFMYSRHYVDGPSDDWYHEQTELNKPGRYYEKYGYSWDPSNRRFTYSIASWFFDVQISESQFLDNGSTVAGSAISMFSNNVSSRSQLKVVGCLFNSSNWHTVDVGGSLVTCNDVFVDFENNSINCLSKDNNVVSNHHLDGYDVDFVSKTAGWDEKMPPIESYWLFGTQWRVCYRKDTIKVHFGKSNINYQWEKLIDSSRHDNIQV